MKELLKLNPYLFKYKYRLLLGFLFIIIADLFTVFAVPYIRKAVNLIGKLLEGSAESTDSRSLLIKYALIIIGASVASGLMSVAKRQTIIVTSRLIEFNLKNDIYKQYQRLSLGFYKQNKTGDLINRISEDTGHVRMYLGPGIMYSLGLLSLTTIVVTQMIRINPTLAFYALVPLPVLSFLIFKVSNIINVRSKQVQKEQSEISSLVQDSFSGVRVIKSYSNQNFIFGRYQEQTERYKEKSLDLAKVQALFFPMMQLIIGLSHLFILWMGGKQFISGSIEDIGTIASFFMYINILIWPFISIGWVSSIVQRAEASQKRINEFLEEIPEIENEVEQETPIEGKIEFKNVNFTYDNTGIKALKNISFSLEKGETLAVLGKTGSGKTTLAQLVARIYNPTSGEILIDGQPIKQFNLNNLRQAIGFIPQEAFLFSDTLKANIGFGKENCTEKEIIDYAKKADIHENIIQFKEGYNTIVGERGVTLSGGQKQRVSIARALIKNPPIMIFDDSLSAVDTKTEEKILNNLVESTKDKTTIIVTHRVSSAKNANYILVLAPDGKIQELGTHHELMAKEDGEYHKLYQKQLLDKVEST